MRVALLYPEVYDMARFKDKRKEFPPFGVLYLSVTWNPSAEGSVGRRPSSPARIPT